MIQLKLTHYLHFQKPNRLTLQLPGRPIIVVMKGGCVMVEPMSGPVKSNFLERIADAVPALVAVYNIKTGQYSYVNRAVVKLLGYQPQDFTTGGLKFAVSLVHPDDIQPLLEQNQQALEAANANPQLTVEPIANFEYRMKHQDGSWRWVHTDGTIFERSASGEVESILNVSLDITARKNAELQLSRSLRALENALATN